MIYWLTVIFMTLSSVSLAISRHDYVDTQFDIAVSLVETGDLHGAIRVLEQVLEFNPDRFDIHAEIGALYSAVGDSKNTQKHLEIALQSGSVPTPLASELNMLLEDAKKNNTEFSTLTIVTTGIRSESNANNGPSQSQIITSGAQQSDSALELGAIAIVRKPITSKYIDFMDIELTTGIVEYSQVSSSSSSFFGLSATAYADEIGDFELSSELSGLHQIRDSEPYLNELTASLTSSWSDFQFDVSLTDRTFLSSANSADSDQNGQSYIARGVKSFELADRFSLFLGASVEVNDALASYKSYNRISLDAKLAYQFNFGGRSLLSTAFVSLSKADFQAPDAAISSLLSRTDERITVGISGQYNLTQDTKLHSSIYWVDNKSNYQTETFENLGLFTGVTFYN